MDQIPTISEQQSQEYFDDGTTENLGNENKILAVRNLVFGKKLLIIGGAENIILTSRLKLSLELSECVWQKHQKSQSPLKIEKVVPAYDYLMLNVLFLSHLTVSNLKRVADQCSIRIIMNDGRSIGRVIENIHEQLTQKIYGKQIEFTGGDLMVGTVKKLVSMDLIDKMPPDIKAIRAENAKKQFQNPEIAAARLEGLKRARENRAAKMAGLLPPYPTGRKRDGEKANIEKTQVKEEVIELFVPPVEEENAGNIELNVIEKPSGKNDNFAFDLDISKLDNMFQNLKLKRSNIEYLLKNAQTKRHGLLEQVDNMDIEIDELKSEEHKLRDKVYAIEQLFLAFDIGDNKEK